MVDVMIGSTASLNHAAFLGFVQTEAYSLLICSVFVVALVTFIELVLLKREVRRKLYQQFLDVQAKGIAHGQAIVPWLLRSMSMRVERSLMLVLSAQSTWRRWWTWKRTVMLIQAMIGIVTLATCVLPLLVSMMEVPESSVSEVKEEPRASGEPCGEDSVQMTSGKAKFLAAVAVFVGGALMNCKAFMSIPVL